MRIGIGAVLLMAAPGSRMPRLLRVLGVFVILAGFLTPAFGAERSRAMVEWLSTHDPMVLRSWAGVAVAFGLLVVGAARPAIARRL